ncbi:MAG: nitrile hydratase subunit beta, partial [Gemmatimonadetes bacterium]|nr:nitrile hydratase subunit beta [Gemmatimonadota bacterium]
GHTGIVREHYGSQVYPDLSAQGVDEGRHLYNVRFDGRDLWGESANVNSAVYVDLWETYLEPAP